MEPHPQLALIGSRLRELRQGRGLSQEQFALEIGLARSYYSGVERGRRNLATLNLVRIAAALGVEVGALFPDLRVLLRAGRHASSSTRARQP